MKRSLMGLAAAAFAFTAISTISAPVMAATTLKCPACGMPMPTHKTAMMTVPVKIKGKLYYCCAGCPAGKAHLKSNKKIM